MNCPYSVFVKRSSVKSSASIFVQCQGHEKVIQSENENAAGQIRMTKVTDVVHHGRWKFIDQKIVALYLIFA